MKMVDGKPVKVKPENISVELKGVKKEDVIILRKTLQLNYVSLRRRRASPASTRSNVTAGAMGDAVEA